MQTIVRLMMYQIILIVLSLPCVSYAKVRVETNDPSLVKSEPKLEQKLLLPQYSDQELLDKEYELRNDIKKMGKRPPNHRETGAKIGLGVSGVGMLVATYLIYTDPEDFSVPFVTSQTLGGLAIGFGSLALFLTSSYYYRNSARAYDSVYIPMNYEHNLTLKAIGQRNKIREQQTQNSETSSSQNSKSNFLKLKRREPWSSHQKAWGSLVVAALMGMRGYVEHQKDPENSKMPLYMGGLFGGSFLVMSVYYFHKTYQEYTDAKTERNFDGDEKSPVSNTWIAPSLIDRDWGLAIGFQF